MTWKEAMLTKVRQTWEEEHEDSVIEDDEAARQVKKPDFLDQYLRDLSYKLKATHSVLISVGPQRSSNVCMHRNARSCS